MESDRPQLVLLDLVFPDTDGIELMQDILDIGEVPVIFLTAYGRDQNMERAFDMGAADYMVKPFSATELTARIKAALRKHAGLDHDESPEPFNLGDFEHRLFPPEGSCGWQAGPSHAHRVRPASSPLRQFGKGTQP